MKPVSIRKIALSHLDLRCGHFGAVALLKGKLRVFLADCCQCILCARENRLSALAFAAVSAVLGFALLPRYRSAFGR